MAIKYYDVQKFSTLREMWELAKNESGEKVAYMFKIRQRKFAREHLLKHTKIFIL